MYKNRHTSACACMNGIIKTKSLQTFLAGLTLQMWTLKGMSSRDNKYFLHLITSNVSNTVTRYRILKTTLPITKLFLSQGTAFCSKCLIIVHKACYKSLKLAKLLN